MLAHHTDRVTVESLMRKNGAPSQVLEGSPGQKPKVLGHVFVLVSWRTVGEFVSFEILSAN